MCSPILGIGVIKLAAPDQTLSETSTSLDVTLTLTNKKTIIKPTDSVTITPSLDLRDASHTVLGELGNGNLMAAGADWLPGVHRDFDLTGHTVTSSDVCTNEESEYQGGLCWNIGTYSRHTDLEAYFLYCLKYNLRTLFSLFRYN